MTLQVCVHVQRWYDCARLTQDNVQGDVNIADDVRDRDRDRERGSMECRCKLKGIYTCGHDVYSEMNEGIREALP